MQKIFYTSLFFAYVLFSIEPACCRCENKVGHTGPLGPAGPPGPSSFEINEALKVTSQVTDLVGDSLIPFSSPIVLPTSGIDVGSMTLVESVPASGNFDTITLPIENFDTYYLVTYGVAISTELGDSAAEFQLVVNGASLPYTILGIDTSARGVFVTRTSIVINPANTAGTLSLFAITSDAAIEPPTPNSFSAIINVVKLNNNAP